jgi:ribose 5-phosphate isomerase B
VRIVLVSDHAGVETKAALAAHLRARGHEVLDLGTDSAGSVDYPDFAEKGGRAVASGRADRGVFLCGTGIGISIAANKVRGVRAALLYDENTAEMSRRHNDANVACFGARVHCADRIAALVDRWLATPFEGGRHQNRVDKIARIEDAEGR